MFFFLSKDPEDTLTKEELIVKKIHWFGAVMAFCGGLVWMVKHTIISIVLCKDPNKGSWRKKWAVLRFVITLGLFAVLMAHGIVFILYR